MIKIVSIIAKDNATDTSYIDEIILPFEIRQKSRFKTSSAAQADIGFFLDRGQILRDGDLVTAQDGRHFKITAANESVCTISSTNSLQLTKAAYHLGNRHVPLQVGDGWIRIQQDHVLEDMVKHLGLSITREQAPFEPESGAYGGESNRSNSDSKHHHQHGHSQHYEQEHEHVHTHDHPHDHPHDQGHHCHNDAHS